jgi:hypothetical protein
MKQDIKERWVAALRSGEYKQATGYLSEIVLDDEGNVKEVVGFCCLGVLSEIAVADGIIEKRPYSGGDSCMVYGPDTDTGMLPSVVREWAGLDSSDPMIVYTHAHDDDCDDDCRYTFDEGEEYDDTLSALNDDKKLNFNQIADLIEVGL